MANIKNTTQKKWIRLLLPLTPFFLLLPFVTKYVVNRILGKLNGYYGHLENVHISLFRGSLKVKGFYLDKLDNITGERTLFISAELMELTFSWKNLWKGMLLCNITIDTPAFSFIKNRKVLEGKSKHFFFDPGFPLMINHIEFTNGKIEFIDAAISPVVVVKMDNIHLSGTGISNSPDAEDPLPVKINVSGKVYEGTVNASLKANLHEPKPLFELSAEVRDVNMVDLNDFFRAYGKFDINKGMLGLYTEVSASEGKFSGYVESVMQDIEVLGPKDREDTFLKFLWESMVGLMVEILEDHKNDELTAEIPFSGVFKEPDILIWNAIVEVLSNAFLHGISQSIKYEIDFERKEN